MSMRVYLAIPEAERPPLRVSKDNIRGPFSAFHQPLGEATITVTIPQLKISVQYDFIIDDQQEEDLILDASFMAHAEIDGSHQHKCLRFGNRTATATSVVRRLQKVRRITVQRTWVVRAQSRQLVPGGIASHSVSNKDAHTWVVEPTSQHIAGKPLLVGRSLCSGHQVGRTIPVEVYNPTEENVTLYKGTTLALLTQPIEVTAHQIECQGLDAQAPTQAAPPVVKPECDSKTTEVVLPEELEALVGETSDVLSVSEAHTLRQLIADYRDVFALKGEPLGQTTVATHEIKTEGPPIRAKYRRVPPGWRDEAVREEERMKQLGVIEPSDSPWASPVVLVRKKDGSLRYCLDYRRLNNVTTKDSYPLPNMQACLESLEGSQFFSTMDLCSGYWQVRMDAESQDKTSFYGAGGGLWRFKVMPFGLCNAPATFERLMENVLRHLQWQICLCYIDDVLIFSQDVPSHFEYLSQVLGRLREAGLKLKPKKCHFFRREVHFLGHVVSQKGIKTDPSKVAHIVNCAIPTDVHEVRSILGLFSYYRRFIPQFSTIAKPLILLTEKAIPFLWTDTQQEAFDCLKQLMTEAPILGYPLKEGRFILDTDASNVGIGAVLSQEQDGEEVVIAYASRTLGKAERNYCSTRRELLAVVHFCDHFRHYLLGRRFLIRTDNLAVSYWQTMANEPQGQAARWMMRLGAYTFDLQHRAGQLHGNADGMSRPPVVDCAQCELPHQGGWETKRRREVVSRVHRAKTQSSVTEMGVERELVSRETQTDGVQVSGGVNLLTNQNVPGDRVPDIEAAEAASFKPVPTFHCAGGISSRPEAYPQGGKKDVLVQTDVAEATLSAVGCAERPVQGGEPGDQGGLRASAPTHDEHLTGIPVRHHIDPLPHYPGDKVQAEEKVLRANTRGRAAAMAGAGTSQVAATWVAGLADLDKTLLLDEQRKDPAAVDAMGWIHDGRRPNREHILALSGDHKFLWANFEVLQLQDGLLCRYIVPTVSKVPKITWYVPPTLRRKFIKVCHESKVAGHFYSWKTVLRLKRHFCWVGLATDVQIWCKACHVCATRKTAGRSQRAPMRRYDTGLPMEEVAIDLMGPFPVSQGGNKYVLVVVDSFTKWMEAYAIPNIEAQTVAEKLVLEFFSRFGVPLRIKSDQGRQFQCELFRQLCLMLEIDHHVSTAFHPQGNSRVERMVKVVGNLIAAYCDVYQHWDRDLPLLTLAYRSATHNVTGLSPNLVMMGREVLLPLDVMLGDVPGAERGRAGEYVAEVRTRLQSSFEQVRDCLKKSGERQRRYYNLNTHGEQLKAGDAVYMMEKTRKVGVSPKLAPKWKGPFLVLKRFGTVYEVLLTTHKSRLIHFDLLKPCHGTELPSWLRKAKRKL